MKSPLNTLNLNKKSFSANTFFLLTGQYANRFFMFLFFIIFARSLGDNLVGQYSIAVTFTSFITMFVVFGFDKIVERGIAQNNRDLFILVISALIGVFIFWLISIPATFFLLTKLDYSRNVIFTIQILTLYVISSALLIVFNASFRGLERMDFEASLTFFSGFLFLLLGSFATLYFKNIIYIALAMVIERTITVVIAIWIFIRIAKRNIVEVFTKISTKEWFAFLKSTLPFVGVALIALLYQRVDILILAEFLSDGDVGQYSTAYRVFEILILLPSMIATAAFPIMTQSQKLDRKVYQNIAGKSIQYSLVALLPIIIGAFFLGQSVIEIIFGEQFRPAGILLKILVWGLLSQAINNTLGRGIIAYHHEKSLIIIGFLSLAVNITLNIILIPKIGVIGAVWATLGSYLISTLLHLIIAKKYKLMPDWTLSLPPILGMFLVCLIIFVVQPFSNILAFGLGGIVYIFLMNRFGILKIDSIQNIITSIIK